MTIHFSNIPATFRHCRRVGSTSFKFWVFENFPDAEVMSDESKKNAGLLNMSLDEINARWTNTGTTFAFVRNPYARLVSIFHWVGQTSTDRIKNKVTDNVPFELDIKVALQYAKGFDHWIKNIEHVDYPHGILNLFKSPRTQMHHFDGVVPDLVVKLENIEAEFIQIQDLLKCYKPIIHRNASKHDDYRQYYTPETIKIAGKWIEEDLDAFGYTF